MKYLTDYIEEKQTEAFDKAGAFFAFSDKQFEEQKEIGGVYVSLGSGVMCREENVKTLIKELAHITTEGIKQDIKENTAEGVIKRELYNHEAFYTGDWTDTKDALVDYKFTDEQIKNVYYEELTEARALA